MAGLGTWTEEKSAGLRPGRELVVPLGLLAIFALTICAYAASLAGGWVWDDPFLLGDASVFRHPLRILTQDAWSATGHEPARIYRPLSLLSHAVTQILWPGPPSARLFSLALHLLNAFLVARLVVALRPADATRRQWSEPALFGAAVFALHPLATQTVAWTAARDDLLGSTFILAGWLMLLETREASRSGAVRWRPFIWAGLCLGVAVFSKEPFVLVPVSAILLGWGMSRAPVAANAKWRRGVLATFAISLALVIAYLVIRRAAEIPFPIGAATDNLVAAIGGVLARGLVLLLDFSAPDPFPPYQELPLIGGLAVVAGLAGLALSRGRPALALFCSAGILMLPAASASAAIGVFGDRYYYIALAGGIAPLAGCAYAWLQKRLRGAKRGMLAIRILWLLPLLAGFHTSQHAAAWTSNLELYQRAWVRSPENPHAAFHLAYELHTGQDNCEAAIPLYRLGRGTDVRAGNNLQACLLSLGHLEEAAALASELLAADPDNPGPAYNSALVAARAGDERAAKAYALEALRRRPSHRGAAMLLAELSAPRQD